MFCVTTSAGPRRMMAAWQGVKARLRPSGHSADTTGKGAAMTDSAAGRSGARASGRAGRRPGWRESHVDCNAHRAGCRSGRGGGSRGPTVRAAPHGNHGAWVIDGLSDTQAGGRSMIRARHPCRVVGMLAMTVLDYRAPGSTSSSTRVAPRRCTQRVPVTGTANSVSLIIRVRGRIGCGVLNLHPSDSPSVSRRKVPQ